MRTSKTLGFIAIVSVAISTGDASAQSGSWSAVASGNWSNAANWSGGVVANGANNTATFSLGLTNPITVTLDSSRTIGNLVFDNSTASSSLGWTLRSNTLTLSNTTQPTISVGATSGNANVSATLTATLAGTQGFMKTGPGTLLLSTNNPSFSGGINIATRCFDSQRRIRNQSSRKQCHHVVRRYATSRQRRWVQSKNGRSRRNHVRQ